LYSNGRKPAGNAHPFPDVSRQAALDRRYSQRTGAL
jgi:hypothetical protein